MASTMTNEEKRTRRKIRRAYVIGGVVGGLAVALLHSNCVGNYLTTPVPPPYDADAGVDYDASSNDGGIIDDASVDACPTTPVCPNGESCYSSDKVCKSGQKCYDSGLEIKLQECEAERDKRPKSCPTYVPQKCPPVNECPPMNQCTEPYLRRGK